MFVHENKLFWMLKELTCILNIIIVKSNVFLPEQFFNTDRLTLDVNIFKLCWFISTVLVLVGIYIHAFYFWITDFAKATNKLKRSVAESVEV